MHELGTYLRIGLAGALTITASCGSADDESRASTTSDRIASESSYCADVEVLTRVLDDGGTVDEYNELMERIVVESPAEHLGTWSLMLALSEEPFSYDNFNPAVDSLDRLGPDLDAACPELPPIVVDDAGRIHGYPPD